MNLKILKNHRPEFWGDTLNQYNIDLEQKQLKTVLGIKKYLVQLIGNFKKYSIYITFYANKTLMLKEASVRWM